MAWMGESCERASNAAHELHACSRDMGDTPNIPALQYLLSDLQQMKDQGMWLRGQHPAATSAASCMPRSCQASRPQPERVTINNR